MAAVDYFLKLDGIKGESKDHKNAGSIDVESWSWGESNSGSHSGGGGGGAGKVSMQDFHFVMKQNSASPKLMLACAAGTHIKEATLTCRKAGDKPIDFLVIKMQDLLVSSYQTGGSAGSSVIPMDQISLNFSTIKHSYSAQKADGSAEAAIDAGWDLKKNQKI